MDPRDTKNLRFIMSLSNDQIAEWAMTITQDDMQYAFELIELAKIELIDKEVEVTEDLSLAKEVLKRYTK